MAATGLDKLQSDTKQAARAFKDLDSDFEQVDFDPADDESVRAAVQKMDRSINKQMELYPENVIVQKTGEALKEQFRGLIRGKAAAYRKP